MRRLSLYRLTKYKVRNSKTSIIEVLKERKEIFQEIIAENFSDPISQQI